MEILPVPPYKHSTSTHKSNNLCITPCIFFHPSNQILILLLLPWETTRPWRTDGGQGRCDAPGF
jgi:hypothetical protein